MEDYLNNYDWVGPFSQGAAIVVKDNKYGAILTGGHEITPPTYDYISPFHDGFANAIKKGNCIMIDLSGSECKLYGNKIIRIPKEYDVVRDFKNGFACVKKDGKWGVIDTNCKEIFPPKFFYISDFVAGTAKYKLYEGREWGFLNSDGFCSDCNIEKEPEIDTNGNLIIERYEKTNEINKDKVKRIIRIDNKGNFIVQNGDNDVIISNEYQIARDFYCGLACVQNKDGFWGAVNEHGELIIPFDYLSIQRFTYERSFAVNKNRQLCLVSSSGSVLKEFEFRWDTYNCRPFEEEYAIIEKDKKFGLIDKSGQEVFKIIYDRIIDIKKDCVDVKIEGIGECSISLDGKSCFINNQTLLLPDWCIGIKQISENLFSALSSDEKWGIINKEGKILCDPIFDEIKEIRDDIIVGEEHIIERHGWSSKDVVKYGLYNVTSGVTIPAIYDEIPEIRDNYYSIKKDGLCGLLGLNGEEFLKPEYKDITYDNKGYFIVSKRTNDGREIKQGLLNRNGETVIDPLFDIITIIKKGLYRICEERWKRSGVPTEWALHNDDDQISKDFDEMGTSVKNGLIKVKKYGKSGFINENGSIVIHSDDQKVIELPDKFSWGEDFKEGIAAVWINDVMNYVDHDFNLVLNNNGRAIKILTDIDYVISLDSNQNYIFSYQEKLGLLSKNGRLLISPKYDSLTPFSDNLYLASINEKRESGYSYEHFGLISTKNEEVLPVAYRLIKPVDEIKYKKIDQNVSSADSEDTTDSTGYWVIEKGYNEEGLIDKAGNICLEPIYNSIKQCGNLFIVERRTESHTSESFILDENFNVTLRQEGYIHSIKPYDGKVHHYESHYDHIQDKEYKTELNDNSVPDPIVKLKDESYWLLYCSSGYGLISENGNLCIDTKYDSIVQFEHGFYVKLNGNWGILNDKFEVITEPKYESIKNYRNGYKKVIVKESEYVSDEWGSGYYDYDIEGIIDENGREIIEPIYHSILDCGEGGASIVISKEKELHLYGVMNEKFELIVQPVFSYISAFQDGKALAIKQINDKGSEGVFQCGYLDIKGVFSNFFDLIDVKNESYPDRIKVIGKTGDDITILQIIDSKPNNQYCAIINQEGEVIVPFVYHTIESCEGNTYKAGISDSIFNSTYEWHLLDSSFNELTHEPCKSIIPIQNRYVITLKDSKVGLINHHGKVLLPFNFSSISEAGENRLWIEEFHENEYDDYEYNQKKSGKYGLASLDGEIIIEPKFHHVSQFVDNRAIVSCSHDEDGVIDIDGNEIIPLKYRSIKYNKENKQFEVTKEFPGNSYYGDIKRSRFNIDGYHLIKDANGNDIIASKKFHWQEDYDDRSCSVVYKDGEKGLVDAEFQLLFNFHLNGEERVFVLPSEYDWGAIVSDDFLIVEKNNKKGVLKTDNTLVIDCLYDKIELPRCYDGLFLCATLNADAPSRDYEYPGHEYRDYQWTLINKDGKTLFSDLSRSTFKLMGNSFIAIKEDNGKYLIYDCNGRVVTSDSFDVVSCYSNHSHASKYSYDNDLEEDGLYAIVGVNERFGAINRLGVVVIPVKYENLTIRENNQIVVDGYLMNILGQRIVSNNEFILPIFGEYDDAKICENGLIIVRKDNLYGCVTQNNAIVIPIKYEELECYDRFFIATDYQDHYYSVTERKAVINYLNEVIIPFDHNYTEVVIGDYFIKCRMCNEWINKWGAYSFKGEMICDVIYDEIEYFANNLIKVGLYKERYGGTLYGLIDFKGNSILPLKYSWIGNDVENGRIPIRNYSDEGKGFIDILGNVLLEPIYSTIGSFIDGFAIVSKQYYDPQEYDEYSIYGVIDCSCNVVIPCVFREMQYEKELGLFKTEMGYKMPDGRSIIELDGAKVIVNEKYAYCSDFNNGCAIATRFVDKKKRYGLINTKSEDILPPVFPSLQYMNFGLYVFKLNGKWGVVNGGGNIVLPNLYDGIGKFDGDLAMIKIKNNVTNKGEIDATLYGYINSKGETVLPAEFSFIGKRNENYSVIRKGLDGTWGLFNRDTQEFKLIENAAYIGPCKDGLCLINVGGHFDRAKKKTDGGKWGYIFADGKEALSPVDYLGIRSDNYSVIRNDKTWGLFNLTTFEVKMIKNASYLGPYKDGLCLINLGGVYDPKKKKADGGKWGYIDIEGKIILPALYDFIGKGNENYSVVRKNQSWGLFNLVTHEVKTIEGASCIGPCNDGLCRINVGGTYDVETNKISGGKWGYFDPDKGIAIEPNYSMAKSFSEGIAAVKIDNKWGFINKNGDVIVPCEYDELISSYSDGKGELLLNDDIYVFDKEGKTLSSHRRRYYDDDDDDYDDYYGYDDYDTPTYDKYGGPGGYSDQTIDDAFGGDPDLLWNID